MYASLVLRIYNIFVHLLSSGLFRCINIFSLKKISVIFTFYLQFLIITALMTVFMIIGKASLLTIIFSKLILFTILYICYFEPKLKQKLTYYQNFSISHVHLFFSCFIIDAIVSSLLFYLTLLF